MYSSKYLLTRIVEIQNITLEHTRRGTSQKWVYENIIQPHYHISRSTFCAYLARNAKAELRKLENIENMKASENNTAAFCPNNPKIIA